VCVPLRSYGKGTGIVIHITQTQLWEREGNRECSYTKKFAGLSGQFCFLRIASESEKVFARMLDEFFRRFDLPKTSVFSGQTIQDFKTLTPPLIF